MTRARSASALLLAAAYGSSSPAADDASSSNSTDPKRCKGGAGMTHFPTQVRTHG